MTITVDNATTLKHMSEARVEDEAASDGQPVAQAAAQAAVDRLGAPPARQGPSGSKRRQQRRRAETEEGRAAACCTRPKEQIEVRRALATLQLQDFRTRAPRGDAT